MNFIFSKFSYISLSIILIINIDHDVGILNFIAMYVNIFMICIKKLNFNNIR